MKDPTVKPARKRRQSRVPTTRLGRFLRLGMTAGNIALGGAAEGMRRITGMEPADAVNIFLTAGNAKKLAKRLSSMRGAAMKMGQMMSMESADLLPPFFAEALAILRDSADTMTDSQVRRVMGREYGKGWEQLFASFDYEPLAAASIGQVHYAVAADGRELALKIQYPGVAKSISSDVDNMAMLLRLARMFPVQLDVSGIVAEAKRQLHQEADYLAEAGFLKRYGTFIGKDSNFIVPRVHDDLTTRRILAMDYMPGLPLESLGEDGVEQAERDRVGALLQGLMFRELFEFRTMQSDPNFANYLYRPEDGKIVLLDLGSTVTFSKAFTTRYGHISQALIDEDDGAVRHYAEQIGYLDVDDSSEYGCRLLALIRLICHPICHDEVFDFGASDLLKRARETGFEMFLHHAGDLRAPPPETVFLHRKLMGTFMLCARIKARANAQALIRPYLPKGAIT